jgi:hypothetical protein
MKFRFHNNYVFSYTHFLEVLGHQNNVTMFDATEDIFFGYGSFLDNHYKKFKTGTIQKNHIFKCDDFEGEELAM